MKKTVLICMCIALATTSLILLSTRNTTAQSNSFVNVMPFMTPSGRLGFFNQNDGMIYIYDNDAKELLFKAQLETLGESIMEKGLKANNSSSKSKSIIVPTDESEDTP